MEDAMLAIIHWFQAHPITGTLLALMFVDVIMGLLVAFGNNTINSSISRVGMVRKVGIVLLVAVGFVIEPYAQGMPTGQLTAFAFLVSELISVTENAAKLGLPIPQPLIDALSKLRGEKAPPITVNLTSDASKREEKSAVLHDEAMETR